MIMTMVMSVVIMIIMIMMSSMQNGPFILLIINHYNIHKYNHNMSQEMIMTLTISQEKFAAPISTWQVVKQRTSPCAASQLLLRFSLPFFVLTSSAIDLNSERHRKSWLKSLGTIFKTKF